MKIRSLDQPQPDNREFRTLPNGPDEACLAVLNDVYNVRLDRGNDYLIG